MELPAPRGYANEGPKKSQEVKETAKPCWPHLGRGPPLETSTWGSSERWESASFVFHDELGDFGSENWERIDEYI